MREEPGSLAGRENASSCRTDSFLTRNRELYTSELAQHEICDTNTGRVSQSGERIRKQKEHGKNWDQE